MDLTFDDLIPQKAPAAAGGGAVSFDDLIPASKEKELRAKYGAEIAQRGEPGYGERFIDAATMGLTRPLSGVVRGITGLGGDTTFGERYRAGVGAASDYFKKGEENTPGVGGVLTDVAGAIAAPPVGKIATLGKAAVTGGREALGKLIAQGATTGAIEGAARNAEDVGSAATGAATGGVLGAGASAAVGGAAKLIPGVKGAQRELREVNQGVAPQALKDEAKDFYRVLDSSGIAYAQPQTATLKQGIDALKATNQYNPIAHSKISDYVDQLDKLAQKPQGATFTELHNLRSALAKEARGNDASTREASGKVISEIDKLVQTNQPAHNPQNVNIKSDYPEATRLWKAAAIADDVSYTAGKAERKAASKAGINPDEANRGAFRPLQEAALNPRKYSPFRGPEERALLARIVQGDRGQNLLRGAAEAVPTARAVAGAGAAGLGLTHGMGPLMGALGGGAAAGGAVQGMLNRAAAARGEQNIDALLRQITTGSSKPTSNLPSDEAMRILLAKQAAQRAGAAYAGGKTGE
jgi:hypothetical protein